MGKNEPEIVERLGVIERNQLEMLALLKVGASTANGAGADPSLPAETEAALQGVVLELRTALAGKSGTEQAAALLEAVRATLGGVHVSAAKVPSSVDPTKFEHSIVLASYSPAEVVHRFASMPEPTPITAAEREDFVAAVGFVDVSGAPSPRRAAPPTSPPFTLASRAPAHRRARAGGPQASPSCRRSCRRSTAARAPSCSTSTSTPTSPSSSTASTSLPAT